MIGLPVPTTSQTTAMKKITARWFKPGKPIGWRKSDSQTVRRQNVLKSRKGDLLKSGRACLSLANVTQDAETQRKAAADAKYFFAKYKQQKQQRGK